MAIIKSWCLIPVVIFVQLFTSTWVFADDAGFNSTSSDSLNESTSLVGAPNGSGFNNQEQPAMPQSGLDQNFDFSQLNNFNPQQQPADQPQHEPQEVPMPTRPPNDPNRAATFPPLVHNDQNNATGKDAPTTMKPAGTGEKSKGGNNGIGGFYGSAVVVLCGASVLHLLN